jgi:hypothetical protein
MAEYSIEQVADMNDVNLRDMPAKIEEGCPIGRIAAPTPRRHSE